MTCHRASPGVRDPGRCYNAFYDLALEVILSSFHKILLVAQVNPIRCEGRLQKGWKLTKQLSGSHVYGWWPWLHYLSILGRA